jgi:hypothetical protein
MIGGTTSTVLQPLRTITGSGGGGSNSVNASDETTTTAALGAKATSRRTSPAAAGSTATTQRAGHSATTAASPPATTAGGGTPIPTAIGNCKTNDIEFTTHTNKGTYRPNESVAISLAVRNSGQMPCYAPGPCGTGPWATVTNNTTGEVVWKTTPKSTSCANPPPSPPLLNPNDTYDYGTIATWNQIVCPNGDGCSGAHAPIGSYSAIGHRNSIDAQPATFALRSS